MDTIKKVHEGKSTMSYELTEKEAEPHTYTYGMRARGFSPACQPQEGFLSRKDDPTGKYFDKIVYGRKLTDAEVSMFQLDYLPEKDNSSQTRLTLLGEAYYSGWKRLGIENAECYESSAEDEHGNEYTVLWECRSHFENLEDACDWNEPWAILDEDGHSLDVEDFELD